MVEGCVFCGIARGEVPCYKIWEDKNVISFLDINPCSIGHTIVIPKKHERWIWDIGEESYIEFMLAVKKIAGFLRKAFGVDCVQESIVGFDMHHIHAHLFPRAGKSDGLPIVPIVPISPKPSEDEMNRILEKIRAVVE